MEQIIRPSGGFVLKDREAIEDLQLESLRIIQSADGFRYGMDAVLLADFANVKPKDALLDLGTGTGILPLLIWGRKKNRQTVAVEILPQMADMAVRSMALNGLSDAITILCGDFTKIEGLLKKQKFDYVVSNPPYVRKGTGISGANTDQASARHEVHCTLEDVVKASAAALRYGGKAAYILHSSRALEMLRLLKEKRLEPKRIRMVQSFADRPPHLMLAEAMKNGKEGLQWMPALVLYEKDGSYSKELSRIYHCGE
ncbi:MAG: tRNA1(Val) (adenine(37)-N6)-methyltransferase [Christensenellales bacterium]